MTETPADTHPSQPGASFLPDFCGTRMVFVVVIAAELLAVALSLARLPAEDNPLIDLALNSLFIQWGALGCTAVLCLSRQWLNGLRDQPAASLAYLLCLLTCLLISETAWLVFRNWLGLVGIFPDTHVIFLLQSMGISAIAAALGLRYFYVQHQLRLRIKSEAEARYQALQSRIRPHFLFNCMNTIASLVRRDPILAEQAIEDLSDLFRAALADGRQYCTLQDEIDLCKRYLNIEKQRLGNRLTVVWDMDSLPGDLRLPVLCLQPLIENAIYHGIETLPNGGQIEIRGERRKWFVSITVENPLHETGSRPAPGNQLAQDNIRQRLASLHDLTNPLKVSIHDSKYRVTLNIPYSHENTDR
ncbi:MAG: hypothetical protein A3I78_06890 [Gammaproteobacteria bacterium RIFCSPLOWO2_02_FULL_56_15]|nr:MAG: hypothetical protein A3I78_06890 [Gammaproteobacteria bacterium RIFCSPLOWO2_02_FULL_56_15]